MPVINLSACPADATTMIETMSSLLEGRDLELDKMGRPKTQKPCLSDPDEKRCRTADKVGYACYGCIGPKFPLSKPLFKHGSCRVPPERRTIKMDLNRVEGDMEVRLELEGHTVTDAWCVGTMYRGFEQILVGRDPGDALVIAPRICGICSTSQLYAAASALETAYGAPIAPNGTRIRNLCLMAESVMSDARHTFLMFTPDFCNEAYRDDPLYARVMELFEPPFKGRLAARDRGRDEAHPGHRDRLRRPVAALDVHDARRRHVRAGRLQARRVRDGDRRIHRVVRARHPRLHLRRWLSLRDRRGLRRLDGGARAPRERGRCVHDVRPLDRPAQLGRGHPASAELGLLLRPRSLAAAVRRAPVPSAGGFYDGERETIEPFRHEDVAEHLRYSRYVDPGGARHPWASDTVPDDAEGDAYSYAKATRYQGHVVQLGPLADLVLAGDPLIGSLFAADGATTWLRQFTRLHRPVSPSRRCARRWRLREHIDEPTFIRVDVEPDGDGVGAINAARGSLVPLGQDQRRQDRELPDHHADRLERLSTRHGGPSRALGGELRRDADRGSRQPGRAVPRRALTRRLPGLHGASRQHQGAPRRAFTFSVNWDLRARRLFRQPLARRRRLRAARVPAPPRAWRPPLRCDGVRRPAPQA